MYFVFSDVHGCLDEMNELLKYWNKENEQLIFLGDMIDRGSDSFGVIKKLMELKQIYKEQVIILRGNHEENFIEWINSKQIDYFYDYATIQSFYDNLNQFKKSTINQHCEYIKRKYPEMIRFLKGLPYHYETSSCIFVHAGINLNIPNWRNDKETMLWAREEYLYSSVMSIKRIFSGHTPTRLLHGDENNNNIWLSKYYDKVVIDGGCVFNGQLNGIKVDEVGQIKDIIQIKKKIK